MTEQESVEALAKRLEETACWEIHREAAATLRAQAAEIERLWGELADGSFYKESDIDALQARAEKAEAERCYHQHVAKVMSDRAAEVEEERDVAVNALRTAYARGVDDAARHIEAVMYPNAERAKIVEGIRALAPDPEER